MCSTRYHCGHGQCPFVKFVLFASQKTARVEVCININADKSEIGNLLTTSVCMCCASLVARVFNSFSILFRYKLNLFVFHNS
jgi:hypothetical protein